MRLALTLMIMITGACGDDGAPPNDSGPIIDGGGGSDGGTDAGMDRCTSDTQCDNGMFCDGAEVCEEGVCRFGTPRGVDDGVACTDDSCDEDADRIVNTPNDANCTDLDTAMCDAAGELVEVRGMCDALTGCEPQRMGSMDCTDETVFPPMTTCEDGATVVRSPVCLPGGDGVDAMCGYDDGTRTPCPVRRPSCEGTVYTTYASGCDAAGTACEATVATEIDCSAMNSSRCAGISMVETTTCSCDVLRRCACSTRTTACLFPTRCCMIRGAATCC